MSYMHVSRVLIVCIFCLVAYVLVAFWERIGSHIEARILARMLFGIEFRGGKSMRIIIWVLDVSHLFGMLPLWGSGLRQPARRARSSISRDFFDADISKRTK